MSRIAVAMSGGVDSSLTAALLLEQGHEVFGITMLVVPEAESISDKVPSLAQNVAKKLGITHYVIDLRSFFKETIIADFCRQYEHGRTPNPCVRCNRFIKFGLLYDKARELGAEKLATGHYARVALENHRYVLRKGMDAKRDQSYFLHQLTQAQLAGTLFPLGAMNKDEVRSRAKNLELPSASSESREICFIPDNDYRRFLKTYATGASSTGDITDKTGRILTKHQGISHFTIGQRHGLGIATPTPLYVIDIDTAANRVIVGSRQDLLADALTVSGVNWVSIPEPAMPIQAVVKIRYLHTGAAATVTPVSGSKVKIKFTEPQSAVTPGQAAVFYDGDIVLGGGTIEETAKTEDR
ncbi:MAG: tRNA 2-thiouridine(34) synthase MnmA [Dehalococcoidales bacterium]|nr:tRNA 2-thiouridine(34) synthase MnmA [Dehalococcoidales bacterium]